MNDLCTALADALRKAGEKWPEKFKVVGYNTLGHRGCALDVVGIRDLIDLHGLESCTNFTLDHMDAVAEALGMEFEVHYVSDIPQDEPGQPDWIDGWVYDCMDAEHIVQIEGMSDESHPAYPTKREASLAALLAIITHALQEDRK